MKTFFIFLLSALPLVAQVTQTAIIGAGVRAPKTGTPAATPHNYVLVDNVAIQDYP